MILFGMDTGCTRGDWLGDTISDLVSHRDGSGIYRLRVEIHNSRACGLLVPKYSQERLLGKRPSFQWYPGDWLRDPGVRSVSYAARGLWIDMLSLMFESDRKGFLQVAGQPVTAEQLARMTGGSTDEVTRLLPELEAAGVFSRLSASVNASGASQGKGTNPESSISTGMIYSRRMLRDVREHEQSSLRAKRLRQRERDGCIHHAVVTRTVTAEYEEEEESSKKVLNSIEGDISKNGAHHGIVFVDEIYSAYPRKVKRKKAVEFIQSAIQLIMARPEHHDNMRSASDWLLGRVKEFAASPAGQLGVYTPHATTWFNQGRYDDDTREWYREQEDVKPRSAVPDIPLEEPE